MAPGAAAGTALKTQLVFFAIFVELSRHTTPTWQRPLICCFCHRFLPPQNRQAAIAKIAPASHQTDLGIFHLPFASFMSQLARCLDDVVHAPDMSFRMQTAVRVDRQLTAKF